MVTRSRNRSSRKKKDSIGASESEKDTTIRNRKNVLSPGRILRESHQNQHVQIHRKKSRGTETYTTNPSGKKHSTRKSQHDANARQRMVHRSPLLSKRSREAVVADNDPRSRTLSAMSIERGVPETAGIEINRGQTASLNPYAPSFVPSVSSFRDSSSTSTCRAISRLLPSPVIQAAVFCHHKRATNDSTIVEGRCQSSIQRFEPAVTVIDQQKKIFVANIVSVEECDWIKAIADQHARDAESMGGDSFRKLYTYTECDLPCSEVLALQPLMEIIFNRVRRVVAQLFHTNEASKLVRRTWKEPHILKYTPAGNPEMVMHYDGSHMTWSLMLDQYGIDYTGGGTYFSCLRKTVVLRKGQVLIHPGGLYHKGIAIEKGIRTLVICFMDGFDPRVGDDSDYEEDSSEFEKDLIIL